MAQFKNGNIVSIHLKNFQTFSDQVFTFGPSLNFIAAPNGSGKSSIANAIALLFNGTPKTIGKSKEILEFVKFGCHCAEIVAKIFYNGEEITMSRKISCNMNGYYINSKSVTQKEYFAFCKELKIDVNNLCTFLPQERVSEFCRMNPKELLIETLKNTEIKLDKVAELYSNLEELQTAVTSAEKKRDFVEDTLNNLDVKKREIKDKEHLEERLKKLSYKKERIEFEVNKNLYLTHKSTLKSLTDSITAVNSKIDELRARIEDNERSPEYQKHKQGLDVLHDQNEKIKKYEDILKKISQEIEMVNEEASKIEQKIASHMQLIEDKSNQIKEYEQESKNMADLLSKQVSEFKDKIYEICTNENVSDLVDLNPRFNSSNIVDTGSNIQSQKEKFTDNQVTDLELILPSFEKAERKIMDLGLKISQIQTVSKEIQKEIEDLTREKLASENQNVMRLEMLKKYHYDTYRGVIWLRENTELFKEEILEPAYLHISLDSEYTEYIENFLGFQSLSSFIVFNDDDFSLLTKNLKDNLNLSINVAMHAKSSIQRISDSDLKKFNLDGVISDFIHCRSEYIDFFDNYGFFSRIPISKVDQKEEIIYESLKNVKRMAVGNRYSEIKRSKYGDDYVIISNKIKSKNIFNFKKFDLDSINSRISELQVIRDANKSKYQKYIEEKEQILNKKAAIKSQCDFSSISKLYYNYNRMRKNLDFYRSELKHLKEHDYQALLDEKNKKADSLKASALKVMADLSSVLSVDLIPQFDLDAVKSLRLDLDNDKRKLALELNSKEMLEESYNQSLISKDKIKEVIENLKKSLRSYPKFDNLDNISDDVNEIAVEIKTITAKLALIKNQEFDMNIVKEKETQLRSISGDLNHLNKSKETALATYNLEKEKVKAEVEAFLNPIKERFGLMFKKFKFEGTLELCTDEKDWELRIKVRFREGEELQQLSSSRQSGGEKSLSTVLFLLALQQSQETFFRLVDEINQGMDVINEKKVFEVIKELGLNSQFFLITPKMIPDIEFSSDTKAIIVYGGPDITKDIEDYCRKVIKETI